jgi:hypothetical protein
VAKAPGGYEPKPNKSASVPPNKRWGNEVSGVTNKFPVPSPEMGHEAGVPGVSLNTADDSDSSDG